MVKFKPLGDKVLIKKEETTVSSGGIHLVAAAKDPTYEATVIELGYICSFEAYLPAGTKVRVRQGVGIPINLDGKDDSYFIVGEKDILGVIDD